MHSDKNLGSPLMNEATARRQFLGQIGKAAVTAPAVALLLAASARPASADYGAPGGGPVE